jgi:hypothetical protein
MNFGGSQLDTQQTCGRPVRLPIVALLTAIVMTVGCRMTAEQTIRKVATVASWGQRDVIDVKPRKSPIALPARNWFAKAPQPSPRTEQLLRKFNVLEQYQNDPDSVIAWLRKLVAQSPVMQEVHALAELSQQQARWSLQRGNRGRAIRMYSAALQHSYQFLFAPQLDVERNAYDPQFRSMCDIYNQSLESLLRVVCDNGTFVPGQSMTVEDDQQEIEFEVRINGRWENERFEKFELVGDYQTRGFENEYRTYGLGVPLIAVRERHAAQTPVEKYYPPDLTLALTAFCHFENSVPNQSPLTEDSGATVKHRAVLTLYDPLENPTIETHAKTVPLQSDTTTPLAYHLDDPLLNTGVLATASLLNAETTEKIHGMYMLEPYDPNKIPVVMVHGLWSSPVTWAHMFNDLRANGDIHKNYQFWFYSYSTAQPFWVSAMRMRQDLIRIREELDPQGYSKSLDQMVLVGHSMGGLISKMQTISSGDRFWRHVSDVPIDSLKADRDTIDRVRNVFFFEPVSAVKRVVTIASPFSGSEFANGTARWFSHKFFTLPSFQTSDFEKLISQNPNAFADPDLLTARTSVDSLSVDSPMIEELRLSTASDEVTFNNIIGRLPKKKVLAKGASEGSDGIVSVESARNDHCESEVFVPEEHSHVHQHAACIYEVQRILLANLANLHRIEGRTIPVIPFAEGQGQSQQALPSVQPSVSPVHVADQVVPVVPADSSSRRR